MHASKSISELSTDRFSSERRRGSVTCIHPIDGPRYESPLLVCICTFFRQCAPPPLTHPPPRCPLSQARSNLRGRVRDAHGHGVLHAAAMAGHVKAVALLVQLGAEPQEADGQGVGAAHYAAYHGHVTALKCMHALGFDLKMCTEQGLTPAHYAAFNGKVRAPPGMLAHPERLAPVVCRRSRKNASPELVFDFVRNGGGMMVWRRSPRAGRICAVCGTRGSSMARCLICVGILHNDGTVSYLNIQSMSQRVRSSRLLRCLTHVL